MDNLSKEQLLLLQQNLTYEQYEQFMSMFNDKDEELPKNINERNKYILDAMKNHEYWGQINGWGKNRVYCYLPKQKHMLVKDTGPHDIYKIFKGNTRKELLKFLDEFKKVTNTGDIKTTHTNHIPTKNYNISGKAFYRDPVIASLDGNTVELSVEQMQFAENTMRYQTTLKFLNGKITKMLSAIRGE